MHGGERVRVALEARCPAKVNLDLRVLGRRSDGFHELRVVFQAIDLWDRLSIGPGRGLSVSCNAAGVPAGPSNLVHRAAALLIARHGLGRRLGAHFHLDKTIPVQAGLGGGSSNAAAALILCDRFWGLGLAPEELVACARELGADVPFFLHGGRALGTGRGDLVEPLPAGPELALVLGCPPFGVPTAEAFGRLPRELTLVANGVSVQRLPAHKLEQRNDFGPAVNDLEPVVFEGWPELLRFKRALLAAGASRALLSGSGSTVYGVFETPLAQAGAREELERGHPGWRVLCARGVDGGVRVESPRGLARRHGA